MPVYTYRCDNCGVQFDRRQSFTDPILKACPDCGKKAIHKVFTPVGIVFKGSGFYATDHRSPSGQNINKHSHEEKSSSSSSSESKESDSTTSTTKTEVSNTANAESSSEKTK